MRSCFYPMSTMREPFTKKVFVSENGGLKCTDLEERVAAMLEAARCGRRYEIYRQMVDIVPECSPAIHELARAETAGHGVI